MGLVAAKCTQCGANIEVDASQEAGICKYCGTAYITEKAINNYNIVNNNYINAENLNLGSESAEQLFESGVKAIEAGKYSFADEFFRRIEQNYPSNYRAMWGYVLSMTCNLDPEQFVHYGDSFLKGVQAKYELACILANDEEYDEISYYFENYEQEYLERRYEYRQEQQRILYEQQQEQQRAELQYKRMMQRKALTEHVFIPLILYTIVGVFGLLCIYRQDAKVIGIIILIFAIYGIISAIISTIKIFNS